MRRCRMRGLRASQSRERLSQRADRSLTACSTAGGIVWKARPEARDLPARGIWLRTGGQPPMRRTKETSSQAASGARPQGMGPAMKSACDS